MIDWDNIAAKLGHADPKAMWVDLYTTQGLSITQISARLGVSRNTVRAMLERMGIDPRSRGGPNNQRLEITDELVNEIRKDGVAAVAKRLGLSYTTVYKRIYRVLGLTIADLHHDPSEEAPEDAALKASSVE